MKKDASNYVRRCDKCSKFDDIIHALIVELISIYYSAPFEQWKVDILGHSWVRPPLPSSSPSMGKVPLASGLWPCGGHLPRALRD